jgi:hypothetical protein
VTAPPGPPRRPPGVTLRLVLLRLVVLSGSLATPSPRARPARCTTSTSLSSTTGCCDCPWPGGPAGTVTAAPGRSLSYGRVTRTGHGRHSTRPGNLRATCQWSSQKLTLPGLQPPDSEFTQNSRGFLKSRACLRLIVAVTSARQPTRMSLVVIRPSVLSLFLVKFLRSTALPVAT